MNRFLSPVFSLSFTLAVALGLSACPDTEPVADAGETDPQDDAGSGTTWPDGIDCDPCAAEEVCRYTYSLDNDLHTATCVARPAACADDATCDCIDQSEADGASDAVCAGVEYNSNSCSLVDDRLVVYCEVNLG